MSSDILDERNERYPVASMWSHSKFELYLWSGQLRGIAALVEDVCYTTR